MYELISATSTSDLTRRLIFKDSDLSSDLKTTCLYKSILNIFYNNIIIVHEQRTFYTSFLHLKLISAQKVILLFIKVKLH